MLKKSFTYTFHALRRFKNNNFQPKPKMPKFSGCITEVELILARSAWFQTLANIQETTVCPFYRAPFFP